MAYSSRLLGLGVGLALLLNVAGCRDDGGSGGPLPYDSLLTEQIDALCDFFVRCGYATDRTLCVEGFSALVTEDPNLDAMIANGTVVYDPTAARACAQSIRDGACTDFLFDFGDESCERVFEGTIGDGGACFGDAQCQSDNCDAPGGTLACCEGTCIAALPEAGLGEDCLTGMTCVEGTYCDIEAAVCASLKASGETCSSDFQCADVLRCVGGTCAEGPGEGEPCPSGDCALPFGCDPQTVTCQRARGEGEACVPEDSLCSLGLTCSADSNTCVRPGGAGSPCDFDLFGLTCAQGTYCDYDFELGEGTCVAVKADGQTCASDQECQTRHCSDEDVCGPTPVCVQ